MTPFSFGRLSDAGVLSLFGELEEELPGASARFSAPAVGSFELDEDGELPADYAQVFGSATYLIDSASIKHQASNFTATYYRGRTYTQVPQQGMQWVRASSEYIDGMAIEGPGASPATQLAVLGIINRHVQGAPPTALVEGGTSALAQSAAILNRVSEAVATLTEHTSQRQRELDLTRSELETANQVALRKLETELHEAHEQAQQELARQEQDLAKRAADLDDRENTHVRRELQRGMASLSDTTLSKNLLNRSVASFLIPVALAVLAVLSLATLITGEIGNINSLNESLRATATTNQLSEAARVILVQNINETILFSQIRIALQSLGAAALVWFALRIVSSRYRQVSRWEQDLHRFRLDTERAGFLIEGDLEARKVNDQGLPEVMLDRFSRNLFSSGTEHSHDNSSESIGSTLNVLLGRAAGVKLGPGGVEVNIDKPGMRRAQRDLDAAEE